MVFMGLSDVDLQSPSIPHAHIVMTIALMEFEWRPDERCAHQRPCSPRLYSLLNVLYCGFHHAYNLVKCVCPATVKPKSLMAIDESIVHYAGRLFQAILAHGHHLGLVSPFTGMGKRTTKNLNFVEKDEERFVGQSASIDEKLTVSSGVLEEYNF